MANTDTFEVVPVTGLTNIELDNRQAELAAFASTDAVRERMRALGLHHELSGYTRTADDDWPSGRNLVDAKEAMCRDEQATYVLIGELGKAVGRVEILTGVDVWSQRLPLPSKIARIAPHMSKLVFSGEDGPYFSVWLDPDASNQQAKLKEAYGVVDSRLDQFVGEPWTVLPKKAVRQLPEYDEALGDIGFRPDTRGFLNVGEARWGRPASSVRYIPMTNRRGDRGAPHR